MDNYLDSDAIRELVRTQISRKVRNNELSVPVLPHIAQEVLSLTSSPNASASDFVKLIEQDQNLSSQLLKIANSPVYAGRVEVTSIQRAIVTIGMRTLRDLVFGVAMGEKVFRSKHFNELMATIWDHSVAVAFISKELAVMKNIEPDQAFMCGLLHDIGKPLLLNTLEEIYRKNKDRIYFANTLVDEILREYHEQVGGLVARSWNFPPILFETIRYHNEYREAKQAGKMALLVNVANLFAHYLGLTSYMEEGAFDITTESALLELELRPDQFNDIINLTAKKARELITSFKVT